MPRKGPNVRSFQKRFPDEDTCLEHLMRTRFGERLTCLSFKGLVRKGLPISARGELTRDEHSAPSLCRLHVVSKRSWSPFSIDCYN